MPVGELEQSIRAGEWLTIAAALLGPILAVQAQKLVEASRAKRLMKDEIFRRLMATRASRLSTEHVQALNMIDIAFYGRRLFGLRLQTAAEKSVCRHWREYLDVLAPLPGGPLSTDQELRLFEKRDEKFFALLGSIALAQNFDFDQVELRNNSYSPGAHGRIEAEQELIRSSIAKVFSGETALKMEVANLPRPSVPAEHTQ